MLESSLSLMKSFSATWSQVIDMSELTTISKSSVLQILHFLSFMIKRMRREHLWQTFLWLHLPIAKYCTEFQHKMQATVPSLTSDSNLGLFTTTVVVVSSAATPAATLGSPLFLYLCYFSTIDVFKLINVENSLQSLSFHHIRYGVPLPPFLPHARRGH